MSPRSYFHFSIDFFDAIDIDGSFFLSEFVLKSAQEPYHGRRLLPQHTSVYLHGCIASGGIHATVSLSRLYLRRLAQELLQSRYPRLTYRHLPPQGDMRKTLPATQCVLESLYIAKVFHQRFGNSLADRGDSAEHAKMRVVCVPLSFSTARGQK